MCVYVIYQKRVDAYTVYSYILMVSGARLERTTFLGYEPNYLPLIF